MHANSSDNEATRRDGAVPEAPDVPENAPTPPPFDPSIVSPVGYAQAPTSRLVPSVAPTVGPSWDWQGAGAGAGTGTPPPPPGQNWYGAGTAARDVNVGAPPGDAAGERRQEQSPIMRWLMRLGPLALLALTKAKWLLLIFKIPAFTTFSTLLLSLWVYAMAFGLPFAAGFIALLFIHEMGHALVMRQQGIKTTPVLFIPFMGALIGMKEMPKNVYAEAKMALGGPILGSLGALACLALWQVTGSPFFVALATTGFWLNLFNLIPVSPLDGGRAMAAISPWGWLAGLALLLLLFLRVHSIFLGFILVVGAMEVFNRWRSQGNDRAYYEATPRERLIVTVIYFGLAALLAFGVYALHGHVLLGQPVR